MTKEEFIKICHRGGYCRKVIAKAYANSKTEFTDEDLQKVFLMNERLDAAIDSTICGREYKYPMGHGFWTTKKIEED